MEYCKICGRPRGNQMQEHHLKPKMFGNKHKEVHNSNNKVLIHKMCHQKIHATFSETELYQFYYTIDRIIEHPEMKKYIHWIKNKPIDFYDKNNDTKERKNKRKK